MRNVILKEKETVDSVYLNEISEDKFYGCITWDDTKTKKEKNFIFCDGDEYYGLATIKDYLFCNEKREGEKDSLKKFLEDCADREKRGQWNYEFFEFDTQDELIEWLIKGI